MNALPDSQIKEKDLRLASSGLPSSLGQGGHASSGLPGTLIVDGFRRLMDLEYGGIPKKHKSPTKRLMQQKEACWKHKEFLSKNLSKGDKYSLSYTCDPRKSYVI